MSLNVQTQRMTEGLFRPLTQDRALSWNGKYGTRIQKISAFDYHFDRGVSSSLVRSVDISSYRFGQSMPNWRQVMAEHGDAGTDFEAAKVRVSPGSRATYLLDWNPKRRNEPSSWGFIDPVVYVGQSWFNYIPLYDASQDNAIDNIALRKFYDEVAKPFDGATFLGELRETVDMFKSPLKAFNTAFGVFLNRNKALQKKAIRDARNRRNWPGKKLPSTSRINRRALNNWRKVAATSFLEWKFGVKPLMADIEDLFDSLVLKLNEPQVDSFKVGHGQRWPVVKTFEVIHGGQGTGRGLIETQHHTAVQYTGGVYTRIDSSVPLGTALIGPPIEWIPALWELCPLSWLIDYGTTIGEALNAQIAATRLRYTYLSKSVRHTSKSKILITPVKPSAAVLPPDYIRTWTQTPGECLVEKKHVKRVRLKEMPLVTVTWQHKMSAGKQHNLFAWLNVASERSVGFKNRR